MQTGAVAVLDALGFKGIWETTAPGEVIQKLHSIVSEATDVTETFQSFEIGDVHFRFFSDTIVVTSAAIPDEGSGSLGESRAVLAAVGHVITAVATILGRALSNTPVLCYRGAIACGKFILDENFLIGPAVDEAASLEGVADGAFVWLAPSALALFGDPQLAPEARRASQAVLVRDYKVPLKDGREFRTHVVNPLVFGTSHGFSAKQLVSRSLARFDSFGIDLAIKRQNTEAFLKRALGEVEAKKTPGVKARPN